MTNAQAYRHIDAFDYALFKIFYFSCVLDSFSHSLSFFQVCALARRQQVYLTSTSIMMITIKLHTTSSPRSQRARSGMSILLTLLSLAKWYATMRSARIQPPSDEFRPFQQHRARSSSFGIRKSDGEMLTHSCWGEGSSVRPAGGGLSGVDVLLEGSREGSQAASEKRSTPRIVKWLSLATATKCPNAFLTSTGAVE